jgi:acetoin utilization deacetylase AcuC-like enzyme
VPPQFIVSGKLQPSPERPERIDALLDGVHRLGSRVVSPAAIDHETLRLVHEPRYLHFLETLWARWRKIPDASEIPLPNVYALGRSSLPEANYPESVVGQAGYHLGDGACPVTEATWEAALASAATAVHGAKLVIDSQKLVYSLCRPPGHHAASDMAAGFCYFNNSALAAAVILQAGLRTAILDIDVHHGNGTQAIFYDRPDVLTVSIHAHPKRFYPFFWGYESEEGRGPGHGFNLNLPLERGTKIAEFSTALDQALARVAKHDPDILVLAMGLDISVEDPFKGFAIETADFTAIGRMIASLGKRILVVQEGGYPSPSLGANLASLLEGLAF